MSKIRTLSDLQNNLDQEHAWRLQEIANLKNVVRSNNGISQKTAVRAAVPLLYAHWEGFIKRSATYYLEFINNQNLRYSQLKTCFVLFGFKGNIHTLSNSNAVNASIATLDFLREELETKAKLKIDSAIKTESNLNSKVFNNIIHSIGLSQSTYEARYNLIDESLLRRRNHIAHGEYLDLSAEELRSLADEVLILLRTFKTDIENAASQACYLRNTATIVASQAE